MRDAILIVLRNLFIIFSSMQESRALHYILGASLLMIAVFAVSAFVMVNSQADSSGTALIENVAPSVASVYITDESNGTGAAPDGTVIHGAPSPLNLAAGTTRTYWFSGLVADSGGDADIKNVKVSFYRSGLNASCNPGTNPGHECYSVGNCTIDAAQGSNLQASFNCPISVQFYAGSSSTGGEYAAGTWKVAVDVTDQSDVHTVDTSLSPEVETRFAFDYPATVDYSSPAAYNGPIPLGTATVAGNNFDFVVIQKGNDVGDMSLSMPNANGLTCLTGGVSTGKIPTANMYFANTDTNIAGSTALTTSPQAVNLNAGAGVGYQHNGTPVTGFAGLNLQIPATGLAGTCTGTITATMNAI